MIQDDPAHETSAFGKPASLLQVPTAHAELHQRYFVIF